jgi:uncharacterized membrane protein YuzA (DUF378 family)
MKVVALVVGVALLAVGLAGFIPQLNPDGLLFGVMPMDTVRSALFIITGLAGIAIGASSRRRIVPPASSGTGQDLRPWV